MLHRRYSEKITLNACYENSKATDLLMFKECLVWDIIRTIPVDQASKDGTMTSVHEGHIRIEAEIDGLN